MFTAGVFIPDAVNDGIALTDMVSTRQRLSLMRPSLT
jgi:hypothetical protein